MDLKVAEQTIKRELQQKGHDPLLTQCVVTFNTIVEVAVAPENINVIKEVFSGEVDLIPDNNHSFYGDQDLSMLFQDAAVAHRMFAYNHRYSKLAGWAEERGRLYLKALQRLDETEAGRIEEWYDSTDKMLRTNLISSIVARDHWLWMEDYLSGRCEGIYSHKSDEELDKILAERDAELKNVYINILRERQQVADEKDYSVGMLWQKVLQLRQEMNQGRAVRLMMAILGEDE